MYSSWMLHHKCLLRSVKNLNKKPKLLILLYILTPWEIWQAFNIVTSVLASHYFFYSYFCLDGKVSTLVQSVKKLELNWLTTTMIYISTYLCKSSNVSLLQSLFFLQRFDCRQELKSLKAVSSSSFRRNIKELFYDWAF